MPAFVRISAVLVGAANAFMLAALGLWFAATGAEALEDLSGYHVLAGLLITSVAGLLAAEFVLRTVRRALQGGFASRYVAMVLGVTLGGALTVLLPAVLVAGVIVLWSPEGMSMQLLRNVGAFTLLGGGLGLIEGVVLAFPLAAILGRVRIAG